MNKIKNFESLAVNERRRIALSIAEAGLQAIDTSRLITERILFADEVLKIDDLSFPLVETKRIFIVGIGKNAAEAGVALEKILGKRLSGGILLDVDFLEEPERLTAIRGTHPFPSETNRNATKKIIELLESLTASDCVIFIISGGGTVLLSQGTPIAQETDIIKALFAHGATIQELNTLRKHLSTARGGFLAQYAYPARVISLIFSDVPGNDIEVVASGPTVKDSTTIVSAESILKKYDIEELLSGTSLIETPKEEIYFEHVLNILFVSNRIALEAMKKKAQEFRLSPRIITDSFTGEAAQKGEEIAREIKGSPEGVVFLYGGETTVTFTTSQGTGGRNQEVALAALSALDPRSLVLSLASDGRDNTPHAGALCDKITLEKAQAALIDPSAFLSSHDSHAFWEKTGDFIYTGSTGSNVSDLIIALNYSS